ncbi:MAG: tetratricopeptide repeat protein [Pirellulales bacterium]
MRSASAAIRIALALGVVFALLATWRFEVLALPPYYASSMSVFRESGQLADASFDFRRVRDDRALDGKPTAEFDRPSIVPAALALLMLATPSPRAALVLAHLLSIAVAALIVVGMQRLLSPPTDRLYAWIVSAAAVTTPLVLAQVEMMGTEVLLTATAVLASLAIVKARFGLAALAAMAAFLVTPWGMIVTFAGLAFSTIAFVLRTTPGELPATGSSSAARRIAGRGMALHSLVLLVQLAVYWGNRGPRQLPVVMAPTHWFNEVCLLCPDVGLLAVATLAVSAAALTRQRGRTSSGSWPAAAASIRSVLQRTVAHDPLPLSSAMLVVGTAAVIYSQGPAFEVRRVLLLVPFVYLWFGWLVYRRSHRRLSLGVPIVLLLLNLANLDGRWFPTPQPARRSGDSWQRSREYLAELRSHVTAMRELAKAAASMPVVAAYPFTHYLSFPRLGYVDRPLSGYSAMPLRGTGFRQAVELFRDHPRQLVLVYCENLSLVGQIATPPPAAGDPIVFACDQPAPLTVFERDLRLLDGDADGLDRWYIDHLWAANVAGAPPSLWSSLALYLASQGRSDLALRLLASRVEQAPEDLTTRLRLAATLVESGRPLESIRHCCVAVGESIAQQNLGTYADSQYLLGVGLLAEHRLEDARLHLAEALRAAPRHTEARFQLGLSYLLQEQFADAERAFRDVIRAAPDHAVAYYHLGRAQEAALRRDEAIHAYRQAIALRPDYFEACAQLAQALTLAGRPREAVACYRQALALRHDWLPGLNALCWLLATSSDPAVRDGREAVRGAEAFCQQTNFQDAIGLDTLAAAYAETGDFRRAIAAQERAIQVQTQTGGEQGLEPLRQRLELYRGGRPFRQEAEP